MIQREKLNQCNGVAYTIPRFESHRKSIKEEVSANKPNSVGELWKAVQKIWGSITVERCQYLVVSMGRHCLAVIANKGHATKY